MVNEASFPRGKRLENNPTYQLHEFSRLSLLNFSLLLCTPSWHVKHAKSSRVLLLLLLVSILLLLLLLLNILLLCSRRQNAGAVILKKLVKTKFVSYPFWMGCYQSTGFYDVIQRRFFFKHFITNFHLKATYKSLHQPIKALNKIQFMTSVKLLHVSTGVPTSGCFIEQRNTSPTL
jgi:hypothetical protein